MRGSSLDLQDAAVISGPNYNASQIELPGVARLEVFFLFPSLSGWLCWLCRGLHLHVACRDVEVGRIDGRRREIGSRDLRLHQYGIRCLCLGCVLILIRWRSLLLLFAETAKARDAAGEG